MSAEQQDQDGTVTEIEAAVPHLDLDNRQQQPVSCTFALDGRDWSCRDSTDVPFGVAARMLKAQRSKDEVEMIEQIGPFFQAVLAPGQYDDFQRMIDRPDSPFTISAMETLVRYLTEKVMGVPTKPSSQSVPGRKSIGSKSKAGSSGQGTRRTG
jgi:hypothetical protein